MARRRGRILPSASTHGALMAKALSRTSPASRTTRLHSQPSARSANAGPALLFTLRVIEDCRCLRLAWSDKGREPGEDRRGTSGASLCCQSGALIQSGPPTHQRGFPRPRPLLALGHLRAGFSFANATPLGTAPGGLCVCVRVAPSTTLSISCCAGRLRPNFSMRRRGLQKKQGGFEPPCWVGQVSQTLNHTVSLCARFHRRARS
jgi:hypothetical protein